MQFGMCDYVIVNDKIENAVCELRKSYMQKDGGVSEIRILQK